MLNPSDPIRLADTPPPPSLTHLEAAAWRRLAPDLDATGQITRADLIAVRLMVQAVAAAERLRAPDDLGGDPALAGDFADLADAWRGKLAGGAK